MLKQTPQRLAAAWILLLAALVGVAPGKAFAHAVLESSTPHKNSSVSGPDITFALKYNSRVDGARSTLSLLKPDGKVEKIVGVSQPTPDTVSATGHGLTKGAYILRWQVLSSDGHITRGEVPFEVR